MNNKEFARLVQKKSKGWTLVDCEEAIRVVNEALQEALMSRENVTLINFGTFSTAISKSERIGRNPKTKEEFVIKKRVRPTIKWSKNFKNGFVR